MIEAFGEVLLEAVFQIIRGTIRPPLHTVANASIMNWDEVNAACETADGRVDEPRAVLLELRVMNGEVVYVVPRRNRNILQWRLGKYQDRKGHALAPGLTWSVKKPYADIACQAARKAEMEGFEGSEAVSAKLVACREAKAWIITASGISVLGRPALFRQQRQLPSVNSARSRQWH